MRRFWICLAALLMLSVSAAAYEVPTDFSSLTLEEAVADYMEAGQIGQNQVSISYYNTVTGETYAFQENDYRVAASTYKLPLNMYFYELEAAGEIASDEVFPTSNLTLTEIHRQSIVYSNNEISESMIYYFGKYQTYRETMQAYLGLESVDPIFYSGEYYTADMMMGLLRKLYENQDQFGTMIDHMKEARPGEFFKAGVQDYEIAHKYGVLPGIVNDVGIIYTPQPFLLAVYTEGTYGDIICSELAQLFAAYTVWQGEQESVEEEHLEDVPEEVPEDNVEEVTEQTPPAETVPEEELPEDNHQEELQKKKGIIEQMKESRFPWWIIGVLALLLLVFLLRFL